MWQMNKLASELMKIASQKAQNQVYKLFSRQEMIGEGVAMSKKMRISTQPPQQVNPASSKSKQAGFALVPPKIRH